MPVVRAFFEQLFGRKAEMGVDPMECVAAGAAIQAGVLSGEVGNIVLVDVTPLTLGVETLGGVATPVISRNTPIPTKKTEIFTTAADLQTSVTIHVFQGERPMAGDNTALGEFNLDGLPPAPRGVPKIEVTFDIDSNGILDVSAKDMATAKSQSIRITGSTRLPEDAKKRMIDEAQRYADEDRKRREQAEQLNNADSLCYQAEKTLADFSSKLNEDLRKRIEGAIRAAREPLSKHDATSAAARAEALKKLLQEAGSVLYATSATAASAGSQTRPPTSAPAPQEKVVDAEFKEVHDTAGR